MSILSVIIGTIVFAILAPIFGCLLAGLDRKITARMQGRVGPPLLQPYYDVRKLLAKENVSVNGSEGVYVTFALVMAVIAGGIFFSGGNLLLCIFVVTLSGLLIVMAAYSTRSPYAEVGAGREIVQIMSYEPMLFFMAIVFYMATWSFNVSGAFAWELPAIVCCWPTFIGLLFVLTIKLRKSPFDLSNSHHAHQEIVKGITTEMSGPTLAKFEILEWVESVLFLGWVGMFFVWNGPLSIIVAVVACLIVYFLEIWIDNNFARVKWQAMLKYAWIIVIVTFVVNVVILAVL